jgi:hypothetical protein
MAAAVLPHFFRIVVGVLLAHAALPSLLQDFHQAVGQVYRFCLLHCLLQKPANLQIVASALGSAYHLGKPFSFEAQELMLPWQLAGLNRASLKGAIARLLSHQERGAQRVLLGIGQGSVCLKWRPIRLSQS